MSYEKQTWATGDVITANKLNHMEDGIAGRSYDLEFSITGSEEAPEYSLSGLSVDELYEKITTDHEIPTLKIVTTTESNGSFEIVNTNIYWNVYPVGNQIRWNLSNSSEFNIGTMNYTIMVSYDGELEFTATYNSTTKEYTLTQNSSNH